MSEFMGSEVTDTEEGVAPPSSQGQVGYIPPETPSEYLSTQAQHALQGVTSAVPQENPTAITGLIPQAPALPRTSVSALIPDNAGESTPPPPRPTTPEYGEPQLPSTPRSAVLGPRGMRSMQGY